MNCRAFEPLIALYAGRDLDDPAQVEEHLAECPECRQLLEDLHSSQADLREWASDPVDAAFLTAVRSSVLARVEDRPRKSLALGSGFGCRHGAGDRFLSPCRVSRFPPPPPPGSAGRANASGRK